MKAWFNKLTANWNLAGLLLALSAWTWWTKGFWPTPTIAHGAGVVYAIVAAGLFLRQESVRLAGVGILGFLSIYRFVALFTREFTWGQVFLGIALGVCAYFLWKEPDKGLIDDFSDDGSDPSSDAQKPLISLVHLRATQRYLEPVVLAQALSDAWGRKIHGGEGEPPEDADGFVAGGSPLFIVMLQKPEFAMFMVHNHERNYFDEPEEFAIEVPNLRFAQVIRDHSAWLSVDLMQVGESKVSEDEGYRLIGKAVSALADGDVMALLCPQHHFFNLWSEELEKLLCGDAPLDALREEVKAPVFGVPDGDLIENAIAEARHRWPEFVTTFKNRQPGDERFIVKAPFVGEDGQAEHMWLQVFGLEPEYVHGHLVNHPMHTSKLKQGSQVEVPVAEISDWVCPDAEGNALGNFTHQAIQQAARPKRDA